MARHCTQVSCLPVCGKKVYIGFKVIADNAINDLRALLLAKERVKLREILGACSGSQTLQNFQALDDAGYV